MDWLRGESHGVAKRKICETFPKEIAYRHSLAEQADALRSVFVAASESAQSAHSFAGKTQEPK